MVRSSSENVFESKREVDGIGPIRAASIFAA
jgi:hypothetical protein